LELADRRKIEGDEVNKLLRFAVAAVMAMALATGPAALANKDDVIREGRCTGATSWKLKLSPENGRIEVEFEVDQNKVGRRWKFTLKKNGNRFFRGFRRTTAPSGSFELRRVASNAAGNDFVVAKARSLRSGERCRGTATFRL
jgi:hypothetical protein